MKTRLAERGIDLLVLEANDISDASVRLVNRVIMPDKVVMAHISARSSHQQAEVFSAAYSGAIVFHESMERKRLDILYDYLNNH
jgi:hypothetical protein